MSENLEIYESETITGIIEFLYDSYRKKVIKYRFPFYIMQLIIYYSTVMAGEGLITSKDQEMTYYGELVLICFNLLLCLI